MKGKRRRRKVRDILRKKPWTKLQEKSSLEAEDCVHTAQRGDRDNVQAAGAACQRRRVHAEVRCVQGSREDFCLAVA